MAIHYLKFLTMKKAFWALSILVTALNVLTGAASYYTATGAPQQAAAASGALMWIVGFYCLARGVEAINSKN